MEKPWIEKYRPTDIKNLIINESIRSQINMIMNSSECKHIIISGQPGIGKTSCVKCIANEMLGLDKNNMLLEINTTEETYVKNITTTLNTFCKSVSTNTELKKIVILDEADLLTQKSQNEILNKIKEYGHEVHFFLTCNDSTRIIENIQSLSRIIHFPLLSRIDVTNVLKKICVIEAVTYNESSLDTLFEISQGDLRKAINNLQLVSVSGKINDANIYKICCFPDPNEIKLLLRHCKDKNIKGMIEDVNKLLSSGYNYQDILNCFNRVFTENGSDLKYLELVHKTKVLTINLKTKLQLYNFVFKISEFMNS